MRSPGLKPVLLLALLAPIGCTSAMIDATVHNGTNAPVSLIEVDYPSASFGVQTLAPGADFHYRFKIIGSGPLTLTYTDRFEKQHTDKGPDLQEGDRGHLAVDIDSAGAHWSQTLQHAKP